MKKMMLATAAAVALVTGAATWQPAEAQTRYVRHHHGYHHSGWVWSNPVAIGAGAIVGTAAALATAPLWAATGAPFHGYNYAYAPGYYDDGYGYGYGYGAPIYAAAPVVYTTRVAPRRVVYTQRVAPRRVVYTNRTVAPRRAVSRTVVRADRPIRAERRAVRTVRY
jgi:hypothetical protein